MRFREVVDQWLEQPDEANLRSLRDAIVMQERDDRALLESMELLRHRYFQAAIDRMMQGMPRWFLSPAAHNLLALAHQRLGHDETASDERGLSGLALATILASGNGSRFAPWIVLRVSDEYDICMFKGSRPMEQRTYKGFLDAIDCSDGVTYWFQLHRPTRGVDAA